MNNDIVQIGNIIGAILQPLYFCLFIFGVKQIKEKRVFMVLLSIIDYFIIQNIVKFNLGVNADVFYAIIFYINLKLIYKNKVRITDFVTYVISNIILGFINIISFMLFGMNLVGLGFALIIPNLLVIVLFNKINKIETFYKKFWNKHNNKKMLKSVTIRGISAVTTIFLFVILHFWVLYLLFR